MQKSVKEANKLIVNIAKLRGKKIETMDIFFNQPPRLDEPVRGSKIDVPNHSPHIHIHQPKRAMQQGVPC